MTWTLAGGARRALYGAALLSLLLFNTCGKKSEAPRRSSEISGPAAVEERIVDAGTLPPGDGGPDPRGPGGATAIPAAVGIDTRPANARCVAPERPTLESSVALEPVFAGVVLDRPIGLFQAPGDPSHFYVLEQAGKVRRFANERTTTASDVVLDLSVTFGGENDERGLLGLSFHPNFAANRYVYVNFTDSVDGLKSHVERYRVSSDGLRFSDPKRILSVAQPYSNHNGGHLAFGPDGYLYIGFGDGGSAGDPERRGQNLDTLLGKMLRIDVDHGDPYAIPASNPFANGGGKPEIFAHGLRNPWRYSFDRDTGELWVADVGQNCFEEVAIVKRGENHGWNRVEGPTCFAPRDCSIRSDCDLSGLTAPVLYYGRELGQSITGGFVYRGSGVPALEGAYVYGDFLSGRIWAGRRVGSVVQAEQLLDTELSIGSFAEDAAGELYVIDRGRSSDAGAIYRFVSSATQARDTLPQKLSQTGCVNPERPTEALPALIPYQPRVGFWSDDAEKERWLALPDGTQLSVRDDGDFELPRGALTMKTFWLKGRRVETRFFVRYADGSYGGYTYLWNADQSDARLLAGPVSVRVGGTPYLVPSRGQCQACHDLVSNGHIGLERMQLDHDLSYATGKRANQLATLLHLALFDRAPPSSPALPDVADESLPLADRARAYLHANCSYCHRPGGPGRGSLDLRFDASDPHLCNQVAQEGDMGVAGARLLVPGKPEQSLVYLRMSTRAKGAMPPLASAKVDVAGQKLIKSYIESLGGCTP